MESLPDGPATLKIPLGLEKIFNLYESLHLSSVSEDMFLYLFSHYRF